MFESYQKEKLPNRCDCDKKSVEFVTNLQLQDAKYHQLKIPKELLLGAVIMTIWNEIPFLKNTKKNQQDFIKKLSSWN